MLRAQVSHTSSLDTAPLTEVLGMTMGFFFPAQSEFWLNFPGGYLLKKRFSRRSLVCTCRWNMRQIDFDCQTCMYNWFGCTLKKKNFFVILHCVCEWVSEYGSQHNNYKISIGCIACSCLCQHKDHHLPTAPVVSQLYSESVLPCLNKVFSSG